MMRAALFALASVATGVRVPISRAVPRAPAMRMTVAATDSTTVLKPPPNREEMLNQAVQAVTRAREAGVSRCTLRLFLPRGEEGNLFPPDESWQGGIMQLYYACSPLVRDLLRRMSSDVAGVPPQLSEQRLDASGVDGESVWFAQSKVPADDAVALVQPSTEQLKRIQQLSVDAGSRLLMLVNPQWKERDDPLDALSRKGGLMGALGNFMGGKQALEEALNSEGFVDTYVLAEYVCRGSRICLQLAYPHGWTASYRDPETETWKPLLSGAATRPTYQEIEDALKAADVPFRFSEYSVL